MAKSRKRIFPKQPVRFHSKLEHELGKYSNKVCPEANAMAIYNQPRKETLVCPVIKERQLRQAEKLKAYLTKIKG